MKKMNALLLVFSFCISFCSCTPLSKLDTISYNDDFTEMYYNGYTYINYNNSGGKYCTNHEEDTDNWCEIARMPYGFFYILGAVTVYYGNDNEKPDFITNSRTPEFYVREDITIDNNSTLSVNDTPDPFYFNLTDVTTGNVIAFDIDKMYEFNEVCNFFVTFEDYPGVQLWITISEYDGKLYLQDVFNSDYYEITNTFKEYLYREGINNFDYHLK